MPFEGGQHEFSGWADDIFRFIFLCELLLYLGSKFIKICSQFSNYRQAIIDLDKVLSQLMLP